jgi:hypothetical protein
MRTTVIPTRWLAALQQLQPPLRLFQRRVPQHAAGRPGCVAQQGDYKGGRQGRRVVPQRLRREAPAHLRHVVRFLLTTIPASASLVSFVAGIIQQLTSWHHHRAQGDRLALPRIVSGCWAVQGKNSSALWTCSHTRFAAVRDHMRCATKMSCQQWTKQWWSDYMQGIEQHLGAHHSRQKWDITQGRVVAGRHHPAASCTSSRLTAAPLKSDSFSRSGRSSKTGPGVQPAAHAPHRRREHLQSK